MANTTLHTAIATSVIRSSKLARRVKALRLSLFVCGLTLVILIFIIVYQITRQQESLDTEPEQDLLPAATPASTRPTIQRRNRFFRARNALPSQSQSSDLSPDSSFSSSSEGYVTAPEWPHSSSSSGSENYGATPESAAPAMAMAEKRTLAFIEEQLRLKAHRRNDSVSSQISAPTASQTSLTNAQVKDRSDSAGSKEDEDAEMIKRRNIKMREEGVRVNVPYSQLAVPTAAPRSRQSQGSTTTASTGSSPSLSPNPAPTPCNSAAAGASTPDHPFALPASGRAGEFLERIDEKLLAVPADAVSRRLLRDGRAILHRKKRTPRSASFVHGEPGQSSASAEGELRSPKSFPGHPAELME